jgi:hypothetical protein
MSILLQLIELIKSIMPKIKSQKDIDDAYLSESADVYDLERRMREIDQRDLNGSRGLSHCNSLY